MSKTKVILSALLCLAIGFVVQLPGDVLSQEGTGTPHAPPTATVPPPPNSRPTVAQPPPTSLPSTVPAPPNQAPDRFPTLTPNSTPTVVGITPTTPPATLPPLQDGWILYNSDDPRLQYSGTDWQNFNVEAATGGTLSGTNIDGATLTIQFGGTAIALLYSQGPEGGAFTVQLDENQPTGANSLAANYIYGQRLEWTNLSPGRHTLTVTAGVDALWIEAVEVFQGQLLEEPSSQVASRHLSTNAFEFAIFGQDFDTAGGLEYTLNGAPQPAVVEVPGGGNSTLAAVESVASITNNQIMLEVTLPLGGVYTVTDLGYWFDHVPVPYIGLPPTWTYNRVTAEYLDAAGNVLFEFLICRYWPDDGPGTCVLGDPPTIGGVSTMRFRHYSEGDMSYPVTYKLWIDNIQIAASGTQFTPTPVTPIASPTPTPITPTATPTPTTTPTLTPDCADPSQTNVDPATVTALLDYGVTVRCDGNQPWLMNELETILTGVEETAGALDDFNQSVSGSYVPGLDEKALFQHIMGPLEVVRVTNTPNITLANCAGTQDTACTNNSTIGIIAFYGTITDPPRPTGFSKHMIVHELGHRFDYQSSVETITGLESGTFPEYTGPRGWDNRALSNLVNQTGCAQISPTGVPPTAPRCPEIRDYAIRDNDTFPSIVMDGSKRRAFAGGGGRGWGSGPSFTVSTYQQSDLGTDIEVAADVFLNWVYASQAGRGGGFANSQWEDNSCKTLVGCPDPTLPGNALYERVNEEWMVLIFDNFGN